MFKYTSEVFNKIIQHFMATLYGKFYSFLFSRFLPVVNIWINLNLFHKQAECTLYFFCSFIKRNSITRGFTYCHHCETMYLLFICVFLPVFLFFPFYDCKQFHLVPVTPGLRPEGDPARP